MDTDLSCLISTKLKENGYQIGRFFRRKDLGSKENLQSGWVFIEGQEDEEYFSDSENFLSVPLSKIVLHNPAIRKFLDRPANCEFTVDPKSGRINELERVWFAPNSAAASNPGRLIFNPFAMMNAYPKSYFFLVIWCIYFLAAVLGIAWTAWIFTTVGLLLFGFLWFKFHFHFKYGDTNPGIIIATNPTLIAVATDLTKRNRSYPVVAVREINLRKINKVKVKPGMRLATVSIYVNDDDSAPHWSDFDPFPVQYATGNKRKITASLNRFSEKEWNRLNQAVAQIPQPYKEGLYRVDVETSDWKDYKAT
ncbi:MAG: DUF3239 domain-containing protein [Desulfatibacillum sp.]|nr:DUF3239 domain-containing protein [Desulfatibacillum sp.]